MDQGRAQRISQVAFLNELEAIYRAVGGSDLPLADRCDMAQKIKLAFMGIFGKAAKAAPPPPDPLRTIGQDLASYTLPQLETLHRRMAAVPDEYAEALGVTWNPMTWGGASGKAHQEVKERAKTLRANVQRELQDRKHRAMLKMQGADYADQEAMRSALMDMNRTDEAMRSARPATHQELVHALTKGQTPEEAASSGGLRQAVMTGTGLAAAGLGGTMLYNRMYGAPQDPNEAPAY